jgi:anthranilate synthase component 1
VSAQAGAGIVYDSVPSSEYLETVSKARAVFTAVAQAEERTGVVEGAARPGRRGGGAARLRAAARSKRGGKRSRRVRR